MKQYEVRFQTFDAPGHTQTERDGKWDYAFNARAARNMLFKNFLVVSHCWVETTEGGRTLARYGTVLKRDKPTSMVNTIEVSLRALRQRGVSP